MKGKDIVFLAGFLLSWLLLLVSMGANVVLYSSVKTLDTELVKERIDHEKSIKAHIKDLEKLERLKSLYLKRAGG